MSKQDKPNAFWLILQMLLIITLVVDYNLSNYTTYLQIYATYVYPLPMKLVARSVRNAIYDDNTPYIWWCSTSIRDLLMFRWLMSCYMLCPVIEDVMSQCCVYVSPSDLVSWLVMLPPPVCAASPPQSGLALATDVNIHTDGILINIHYKHVQDKHNIYG